jgi:hypothetical protein
VERHSLVVWRFAPFGESLQSLPEGCHAACNLALLVLRNGKLDVAEHELVVQESGFVIICSRLLKVVHDEVYCLQNEWVARRKRTSRTLPTMIVDIRVIRVVLDGLLECLKRLLRVTLFHVHTRDFDP